MSSRLHLDVVAMRVLNGRERKDLWQDVGLGVVPTNRRFSPFQRNCTNNALRRSIFPPPLVSSRSGCEKRH